MWSILGLLVLVFGLQSVFSSCSSDDDEIKVHTLPVTDIRSDSAKSGVKVSVDGKFTIGECGICYSTHQNPSINDSHTSDGNGIGTFTSTMSGLKSGTTYYVRAYSNTSSGIEYGNQVEFKTKEDITLSYGSDLHNGSWGLTNGGTDEWGVMFPTSMLSKYNGMKVYCVKVYSAKDRLLTMNIYTGGTTSPTTKIASKDVMVLSGWNYIDNFTPFTLNASQNLWISLGCTYSAGDYPAAASVGIKEKNARWKKSYTTGEWYDAYDTNGNRDLCWMIHVQLETGTRSASLSY